MSTNKTTPTDKNVSDFLEKVSDKKKQQDSRKLVNLFEEASGFPPKMWGDSMIGFGSYHYTYESGREGDFFLVGFSPRKNAISLYFSCDLNHQEPDLLDKLGKIKTGKSCVYIKQLEDVDLSILKVLTEKAIAHTLQKFPN
ncbi:DUF1801 domain-containing protein [Pararhodonellum marinum]|uniref:DUF1801 domain-containing protein n=1 Tax=Pararhodonellum marinum TaxID=2755358 RepID=UPI00188E1834|nr:DUF1801 domain-containing protein [Pararhodonellum marinum]